MSHQANDPKNKAEGPFEVVDAEGPRNHKHAVYARVHVKDATGRHFFFDTSCFGFDLKEPV